MDKFLTGNAYSCIVQKDYSYLCMWMTSKWLERNKIFIRCGKYSSNKSIWENQHHSSIMNTWDVHKEIAKHTKHIVDNCRTMFESRISVGATEKLPSSKLLRFQRGHTTWKVMPRSVGKDIMNWRTKPLNSCTWYQLHALMTINSKKKN